ncbi:hypothetical protein GVAV_002780 [Gurleya vavrai]
MDSLEKNETSLEEKTNTFKKKIGVIKIKDKEIVILKIKQLRNQIYKIILYTQNEIFLNAKILKESGKELFYKFDNYLEKVEIKNKIMYRIDDKYVFRNGQKSLFCFFNYVCRANWE